MNADAGNSSPASATTSDRDRREPRVAESDFLARQTVEAEAAIRETLVRMRESLKDSADITAWTREYPWPAVGVAAAFGFLVASSLTPAAPGSAKEKLSEFLAEDDEESTDSERRADRDAAKPSVMSSLFRSLLRTFGTALEGALVAMVSARAQQPPQTAPSANGHETPAV